jgi:hypothetical protein
VSALIACLVAVGAALPTTLVVLALWVAHARVIDGNSADSVFLSFVFLFLPLIFFVSTFSNLVAVAIGQAAGLITPGVEAWVATAAAGVLIWCCCAWTQGGVIRLTRASAPVSALPVALFSLADMLILGSGLHLLAQSFF